MNASSLRRDGMGRQLAVAAPPFPIAGMTEFSTVDWEGQIVSTIFLRGCPLRCTYCHNADILPYRTTEANDISWETVQEHMLKRKGLLDGLVFSGGEPTSHPLIEQAQWLSEQGFKVGIHTSGIFPNRIKRLTEQGLLDWVGLDVKSSITTAQRVTHVETSFNKMEKTWDHLREHQIPHELRTTWHPNIFSANELILLGEFLKERGAEQWVIQQQKRDGSLSNLWSTQDTKELHRAVKHIQNSGLSVITR